MKIFNKLFGKKNSFENNDLDKQLDKSKDAVTVNFKVRTLNVGDMPFELMINTELSDFKTRENYNWLWTVTIKSLENNEMGLPTDNERKKLMTYMQKIIQIILKECDIRIVGTSLHKEIYDIMFYAKKEDSAAIGGTIAEMPSYMEDVEGRFLNYKGLEDTKWEKVRGYYEAVSS